MTARRRISSISEPTRGPTIRADRTRLIRDLIGETTEAGDDRCSVAARLAADGGIGKGGVPGARREMLEAVAEIPDLGGINFADCSSKMGASRFVKEGALEPCKVSVRPVPKTPVVPVGRFTSPDPITGGSPAPPT